MATFLTAFCSQFVQSSDRPLLDCLPYGPMIDDTTMLLHEPIRFCKNRVPRHFGLSRFYKLAPLNIDTISDEDLDDLIEKVAMGFRQLRENCLLEFRMTIRTAASVPEWEPPRLGISHETIDWQRQHIRGGMVHHIKSKANRLTTIETTAGLRMPMTLNHPNNVRRDLMTGHGSPGKLRRRLAQLAETELSQFDALSQATEAHFLQMGLSPEVLATQEVLALTAASIAPTAASKPMVDPTRSVRETIAPEDARFDPKGFQFEELEARVFTLQKPASRTFAGMLSAARKPSIDWAGFDLWDLANEYPLTLVVQMMMPNQAAIKAPLARRQRVLLRQLSRSGFESNESRARSGAFNVTTNPLSGGSDQVVRVGAHVITWGKKGDSRPIDASVRLRGHYLGLTFSQEREPNGEIFGTVLPVALDPLFPTTVRHLKRAHIMTRKTAIDYLPIWGNYTGHRVKMRATNILLNSRGEAFAEDSFERFQPSVCILGQGRSGKTVYVQGLVNATVPLGDTWVIIDRHRSYRGICELHGGCYDRPTFEEPICFGPFDGPLDAKHLSRIAIYIFEMCRVAIYSTTSHLGTDEMIGVGKLLTDWADKREPDGEVATLGEFAHYLQCNAPPRFEALCDKLTLRLSDFHGAGVYAPFIDGPNQVKLKPGLHCFDLCMLDDGSPFIGVVTAILLDRAERFFTDPKHNDLPKHLVVDDVSFIMNSPQASHFIDGVVRPLARHKAAFYFISQHVSDLETLMGKAMRAHFGRFYFFALSPEASRSVVTALDLPENWFGILSSIRRYEDCSECVVLDLQGESGKARVVLDPDFMARMGQREHHKREPESINDGKRT